MKCTKCGIGDLILYKEVEVIRYFKVARNGKVNKRPISSQEFNTEKDYLECKNMSCNQYFNYELDSDGKITKDLLWER